MSGSYRTELGATIGTPTAHLEPAPHRQQAGGAPQHVYDMLGLMPPGATLAFGQGSGPKGSTPLGIRYGGRGHRPEAAGDTGIPREFLYRRPFRPFGRRPPVPPSPSPLGRDPGSGTRRLQLGSLVYGRQSLPELENTQKENQKRDKLFRYLTCGMWSWRSSHYPCRYLPAATSKLLLRRCASHIHTSCLRHDQLLPRPLLSYPDQSIDH